MKQKNYFLIITIFLLFSLKVFSHSGNPRYHFIIDTDGAIDDLRAISMFLAGQDFRVIAITCSEGTLLPDETSIKVRALLDEYYHQGIPVAYSPSINSNLPIWYGFAKNTVWSNLEKNINLTEIPYSIELLNNVTKNYNKKITLIALGSLTTYADWLTQYPENIKKIDKIVWYNDRDLSKSFNYKVDTNSFYIIKKLNIPVEIVGNERNDLTVNEQYLSTINKIVSVYTKKIYSVHNQEIVKDKISANHLQLWDDLLPLYLKIPMFFNIEHTGNITFVSPDKNIPAKVIYEAIAEILNSESKLNNRVFNVFPSDSSAYKSRVEKILPQTLQKYGFNEWKAIVLTNEIHGHTGIYSIIGAKAGTRACEYFNVGPNNLYATTFAGNKPPLSCFNDGVQISTGSTIGQGLITVSDTVISTPTVIFEFNNQKIKISLLPEITQQIQNDIKYGVENYGFSEKYWLYIEELAIDYWAKYDRHKIFLIEKMQ